MRRTWAVTVLVSAMMAGVMASAPPAGGVAGFGDVLPARFYTDAVQWMVDDEITTGTSPECFSPDDPVTRGQAAAFMWRMEGFPPPGAAHPFGDVVAPWQQEPVSWMFNNMITTGTTATTYSPDENLTRGQLAALLHRLEGSPAAPPPIQFPDVVKAWQITPVGWMLQESITMGTSSTTFSPEDIVTRGQLAAFFYRYKGSPDVMLDALSPACSAFVGDRLNIFDNLVIDGELALADHPGCIEIGVGPPPGDEVVFDCSTTESYPAGVPFHVHHGIGFGGEEPDPVMQVLAGDMRFDLAVDGVPLRAEEVFSTDVSPVGSMGWVYAFRDGLVGSHTFVGEWYEEGVLGLRSEVVVTFT